MKKLLLTINVIIFLVIGALLITNNISADIEELDNTFTMTSVNSIKFTASIKHTDEDASDLRKDIDGTWGDGEVTEDEVKDMEDEFESELEADDDTSVYVDNMEGQLSSVQFDSEGAEGDVDSTDPITLTINIVITFHGVDEGENKHTLKFTEIDDVDLLEITVPRGWEINNVKGLDREEIKGREVSGYTTEGQDVEIIFEKAGDGNGDDSENADFLLFMIFGIVAIIVIIVVILIVFMARKRRRMGGPGYPPQTGYPPIQQPLPPQPPQTPPFNPPSQYPLPPQQPPSQQPPLQPPPQPSLPGEPQPNQKDIVRWDY